MSAQAVVFMVIILTGVWGGFAALLAIAIRRDRQKGRPVAGEEMRRRTGLQNGGDLYGG